MIFCPGEAANLPIILQECQRQGLTLPEFKEDIAYILATARHESASFRTLQEYGGPAQAVKYGYSGGAKFFGRGYVQLTHDYNYRKFSTILGQDLIANPNLVLEPNLAAFILVYGMKHGSFTGKSLENYAYLNAKGEREINFIEARRTVNGTDVSKQIANYANEYLHRINSGEFNKFFEPKSPPTPVKPPAPPTPTIDNIIMQKILHPTDYTWQKLEKATGPDHANYLKNAISGNEINLNLIIDGYGDRVQERQDDKIIFDANITEKDKEISKLNSEIADLKTEKGKTHESRTEESKLVASQQKEITDLKLSLTQKEFELVEAMKQTTNSSTKPFWESKKFLALASLIPVIPGFLIYLPPQYRELAALIYGAIVFIYEVAQGKIDHTQVKSEAEKISSTLSNLTILKP